MYETLLVMGWCCLVSLFWLLYIDLFAFSMFSNVLRSELALYFLEDFLTFWCFIHQPSCGLYMCMRYCKLWVDVVWLQPIRLLYGRWHKFSTSYIWIFLLLPLLEIRKSSISRPLYWWCMLGVPYFQQVAVYTISLALRFLPLYPHIADCFEFAFLVDNGSKNGFRYDM